MYEYNAWLLPSGIHDGDTIHCGIDLGMDIAVHDTIRFYGLNAPELATPEGKVAKAFVEQWFASNTVNGQFIIQTVKDRREKYGRVLGTILSMDRAHNLNADLIAAGQAVVYLP